MIAFKATSKDTVSLLGKDGHYQLEPGKWMTEEKAMCAQTGLHCTTEPFGVLDWYVPEDSCIWLVAADGDIHEDAYRTRLSCTRLQLVKKLSCAELVAFEVRYILQHPGLSWSSRICASEDPVWSTYDGHPFTVIADSHPSCVMRKDGVVGLVKTDGAHIYGAAVWQEGVDAENGETITI